MWIVVSKLDGNTSSEQLWRFVARGLGPGLSFLRLPSRGQIRRCEILKVIDGKTNTIEYHGLVQIEPVKCALAAIARLNGSKFKGRTMQVKKYLRRASPDRRDHLQDRRGPHSKERRHQDRRRPSKLSDY